MDDVLEKFLNSLKSLRTSLKSEENTRVAKKSLRNEAEQLGKEWFRSVLPIVEDGATIDSALLESYTSAAKDLIRLSAPNNRKSSYLTAIESLTKNFRRDFILPVKASSTSRKDTNPFRDFIEQIKDPLESAYLQEAIDCARHDLLRASAVMAWCCCIDRIHRKIEEIGFARFNTASDTMANETKGRFKRFNQRQNVSSISELREVFDTSILWIIEGMGLIDLNQHTRLRSCFDMRNHGAHPGDAPITSYNLMSMFSDIREIILLNPKFEITTKSPPQSGA